MPDDDRFPGCPTARVGGLGLAGQSARSRSMSMQLPTPTLPGLLGLLHVGVAVGQVRPSPQTHCRLPLPRPCTVTSPSAAEGARPPPTTPRTAADAQRGRSNATTWQSPAPAAMKAGEGDAPTMSLASGPSGRDALLRGLDELVELVHPSSVFPFVERHLSALFLPQISRTDKTSPRTALSNRPA